MNGSNDDSGFASEISFVEANFTDLSLHVSQVSVLPLVHILGGVVRPLGTCFAITNDGLCMTARHVVEEGIALTAVESRSVQLDAEIHGSFGALYVSNQVDPDNPAGSRVGGLLPMSRAHFINDLDIALVKLMLPVDTRTDKRLFFPAFPLRMRFPSAGEPFMGLGYRTMHWVTEISAQAHKINQAYSATRGEVEELHPGGRDRAMLPYPCFRTSARFDAGMSGGPLIDHSGHVFGVVCSSFGTGRDDGGYISYGSLLGPAMAMTLDVIDLDGHERKAFLWDLVEGGAIKADSTGVHVARSSGRIRLDLAQNYSLNAQLDG